MRVLVCGYPRSGNYLVACAIQRAGPAARVVHLPDDHELDTWNPHHLVVPVRSDQHARKLSVEAYQGVQWSLSPVFHENHAKAITRATAPPPGRNLPIAYILLEEIIRTSGEALDRLIRDELGKVPAPWPTAPDEDGDPIAAGPLRTHVTIT